VSVNLATGANADVTSNVQLFVGQAGNQTVFKIDLQEIDTVTRSSAPFSCKRTEPTPSDDLVGLCINGGLGYRDPALRQDIATFVKGFILKNDWRIGGIEMCVLRRRRCRLAKDA